MQPTPHEIGIWILVLSAVLSAAGSVAMIVNGFRTQRRQVRMEESFATLPQLQKVERDLNGRIDGVDHDVKTLKESIVSNGEVRRKSIEGKVEGLRLEVKKDIEGVREQTNSVSNSVAALARNCDITNTEILHIKNILNRRAHES